MRSIIKYPGSKFRIAKQIISYFPEHRTYLEPFFGSGAILFNKDRSPLKPSTTWIRMWSVFLNG